MIFARSTPYRALDATREEERTVPLLSVALAELLVRAVPPRTKAVMFMGMVLVPSVLCRRAKLYDAHAAKKQMQDNPLAIPEACCLSTNVNQLLLIVSLGIATEYIAHSLPL